MSRQLTIEEEFQLLAFTQTINKMSHEQLITFTIELQKAFVIETKVRNELLAHQWGIK